MSNSINLEINIDQKVSEKISEIKKESQHNKHWKIVDSFFKKWSFVHHHIESFAHFVNTTIPETIIEFAPFEYETENYKFSFEYKDVYIHKPCIMESDGSVTELTPMEARLRSLTYSGPIFIRVYKKFINKNTEEINESTETFSPGNLPIMVKSVLCRLYEASEKKLVDAKECIYEQGGYFIVNGTEKVLAGMERMAPNTVYVFDNKHDKDDIYVEISSIEEKARKAPVPFYIHQTMSSLLGRKSLRACINYFKKEFPVGILLKALGCLDFKDKILDNKLFSKLTGIDKRELNILIEYIVEESYHITSQENAFKYLDKIATTQGSTNIKSKAFVHAVLQKEFLPHIGIDEHSYYEKADFVIYMIQSLLLPIFKLTEFDDHDHYKNKRVDTSGPLLASIFKQSWAKLDRELKLAIRKKLDNGNNLKDVVLAQLINITHLTKDLNSVLATGTWSIIRSSKSKTGVSQVLNRFNYQSYLSHCRRLINPMPKNSILSKPRLLHNSSWGLVCCLTGDSKVLTTAGLKRIDQLDEKTHQVITVDLKTKEQIPSNIYNYFEMETDKIYEITTESGRVIKCTGNHPFPIMTIKGDEYIQAKDLQVNNMVLIKHYPIQVDNTNGKKLFISEKEYDLKIEDDTEQQLNKEQLIELGLLGTEVPIHKMEILARLLGLLWTDGWCNKLNECNKYSANFYLSSNEDAIDLMNDIKYLGFTETGIFYRENLFRGSVHSCYTIIRYGSFAKLMILLGSRTGKKAIIPSPDLPQWIKDAPLSVKREFLSAYQGGDGARFHVQTNERKRKGLKLKKKSELKYNYKMNPTRHYCEESVVQEKFQLMKSMSELFAEFGVMTEPFIYKKDRINSDGQKRKVVGFSIANDADNLIRYADTIWYRYSREKIFASAFIVEYLKTKKIMIDERKQLFERVKELEKTINNYAEIGRITGLDRRRVGLIIKKGIEPSEQKWSVNDFRKSKTQTDIVYSAIKSIKILPGEKVYDFTTISDNHNFISEHFTVSNCSETPEGHSIGLVKNMAFLEYISIGSDDKFILEILEDEGLQEHKESQDDWTIFLNGKIAGYYQNDYPYELIRELKLTGIIPYEISVYPNKEKYQIIINSDSGRVMRPLLVIKNNELVLTPDYIDSIANNKKTWIDMIRDGVIELLDAGEQEYAMICDDINILKKDKIIYTHAEIHPATIFGVCANTTPFANCDPAARLTYNSSMAKQSLSVPMTNFNHRMDTLMHVLHYPQRPLCQTRAMENMLYTKLPGGINACVAVTTYYGWNMEDATILNKASVDRGMFRSTFYKTYKDSESKVIGADERFGIPKDEKNIDKLGIDGIVEIGTYVKDGDVIIGKISNSVGTDGKIIKPRCISIKSGDDGIVDKVLLTVNPDGTRHVKVKIRSERIPEIGDKFCAPHSQKGVTGIIFQQEDMPFNSQGICPDIIFNCHSVPSRMTVGHLKELWAGKNAALSGTFQNATAFEKENQEDICKGLIDQGYTRYGEEVLYDGATGEMMKAQIFFGVCYYNRLKHMVRDKMHGRGSRGPITTLCRQPSEGKARDGGLRSGEMERDAYISLGASAILQQRLMNLSDKFKIAVCSNKKCGLFAIANPEKKIFICRACKNKKPVYIHIPYATKQLFLSLYALNIAPRIETD